MTNEAELTGGWVTSDVVRVGDTVRRPARAGSGFVGELLRHLERVGFDAGPRFLGYDERGREMLSFLDGEVPSGCGSRVWSDEQIVAAASLLRRFHDATAGSALAGRAEVVCHNDYGPWNLVWRDERPVAMIDFDNAAPGDKLDDLGYAVWKHLNLGLVDLPTREQARRLRVMTTAYGVAAEAAVVDAVGAAQERMGRLIEAAADADRRNHALAQNATERAWLDANRERLLVPG